MYVCTYMRYTQGQNEEYFLSELVYVHQVYAGTEQGICTYYPGVCISPGTYYSGVCTNPGTYYPGVRMC